MLIKSTPTDVEVLEAKETATIEGGDGNQINTIAVHQVLEIDGDSDKATYQEDVKTLIEWAKEKTGSDDYAELKWAIRDLQLKIGTPAFGDRIKNLARFAYLELEENRIKKEKDTFH